MVGTPDETASGRVSDTLFYLAAILIGAVTGVLGTLLRLGVDRALAWPQHLQAALGLDGGLLLLMTGAVAAIAVVASVWLVRSFAPEAGGSGVQEVEGAMEGLRRVRWLRVLLVKFFGGFLSLGSGLVVGREGPTIHMGASVAQAASETLRLPAEQARGLLAAGAAAGLAAAFSAPLASVLFVIEETRRQFPYSIKTYSGVMLASVISGIVTMSINGQQPFMAILVPDVPLASLPLFAGLGVVLGGVGVVFNRCLIGSMDAALGFGARRSFYIVPAVVGFIVGVLLILRPAATQGGEGLVITLLSQNLALNTMVLIVAIRFVMTMASYATGVPGGIFAPILALATSVGLLYGLTLEALVPLPHGVTVALAVAAMGGLFTATVRAPLVGVVLVAELTGAYSILVPAIVTCLVANLVADWLGGRPIYEVLLERTLRLAGVPAAAADPVRSEAPQQIGGWDQR